MKQAVAIGNMDGVHPGHQALIEAAKATGLMPTVLTFEPHPRQVFAPEKAPFRLQTKAQKVATLRSLGIERVAVVPFSRDFAAQSAKAFVEDLLIGHLNAGAVIVGEDFRFGQSREGDIATLQAYDFDVKIIPPVEDEVGLAFSSTRIRAAIAEGDMEAANRLLGRPWVIEGEVFKGQQLGRTIGIPTANILLGDYQRPPYGIFAAWVIVKDKRWPSAMYLGKRPTVQGQDEWLEAFLLDFDGDLYGQTITVEPVTMIRPDQAFDGIDALKAQMDRDIAAIRALLLDNAAP